MRSRAGIVAEVVAGDALVVCYEFNGVCEHELVILSNAEIDRTADACGHFRAFEFVRSLCIGQPVVVQRDEKHGVETIASTQNFQSILCVFGSITMIDGGGYNVGSDCIKRGLATPRMSWTACDLAHAKESWMTWCDTGPSDVRAGQEIRGYFVVVHRSLRFLVLHDRKVQTVSVPKEYEDRLKAVKHRILQKEILLKLEKICNGVLMCQFCGVLEKPESSPWKNSNRDNDLDGPWSRKDVNEAIVGKILGIIGNSRLLVETSLDTTMVFRLAGVRTHEFSWSESFVLDFEVREELRKFVGMMCSVCVRSSGGTTVCDAEIKVGNIYLNTLLRAKGFCKSDDRKSKLTASARANSLRTANKTDPNAAFVVVDAGTSPTKEDAQKAVEQHLLREARVRAIIEEVFDDLSLLIFIPSCRVLLRIHIHGIDQDGVFDMPDVVKYCRRVYHQRDCWAQLHSVGRDGVVTATVEALTDMAVRDVANHLVSIGYAEIAMNAGILMSDRDFWELRASRESAKAIEIGVWGISMLTGRKLAPRDVIQVSIVRVSDFDNVTVQLRSDDMQTILQTLSGLDALPMRIVKRRCPVLVRFNGELVRAIVNTKDADLQLCHVFLVDHGISATVMMSDIYEIPPSLIDIGSQSAVVRLAFVERFQSALEALAVISELCSNVRLCMHVVSDEEIPDVVFSDSWCLRSSDSINAVLISSGHAAFRDTNVVSGFEVYANTIHDAFISKEIC